MMNMGEKITEDECEFLVEVDIFSCLIIIIMSIRRLMWMEMAASTLKSLLE